MSTGLGQRIKNKRIELGLSQDALAKKMGLKDKSSVCKVEKGDDNLTTDKIKRYATALGVEPSYLMGWKDTEIEMTESKVAKEKYEQIIQAYAKATPEIQKAVELILKSNQLDS